MCQIFSAPGNKEAGRQIDEGRIQADELIFEPEFLLSDSLALEASEKH